MLLILNRTTNEYFGVQTMERVQEVVKEYLKPHTRLSCKDALMVEDIGESRWKRTDEIVIVPEHLQDYVHTNRIFRLIEKP